MHTGPFHIIRYVLFGLVLLFSLIVLGIDANLLNESLTFNGFYFVFEALGVAIATLTLITIVPILIIEFLRKGAFTSLVAAEIVWVFAFMVLWVATAADTSATPVFVGGCSGFSESEQSNCHQFGAVQAFAWLNFIILLGWLVTLILSAVIAHSRGNSDIWTSPVSDTAFFGPQSTVNSSTAPPANENYTGYPPHQYSEYPVQMQQQHPGYQTTPSPYLQGYSSTPATQGHQSPPQLQGHHISTPSQQSTGYVAQV